MEVTYTLTKDDMWAFWRFHARQGATRRILASLSFGVLLGLWILEVMVIVHQASVWRSVLSLGPKGWHFAFQIHEPLLLSFLLFTSYFTFKVWGIPALGLRHSTDASLFSQPMHLRIGTEGVDVVTKQEHMQRLWSEVINTGSDPHGIYIYLSKTTALVVPRRAFATLQQSHIFETEARMLGADPSVSNLQATDIAGSNAVWPPHPAVSFAHERPTALPLLAADMPGAVVLAYALTKADLMRSQWFLLPRRPLTWLGAFLPQFLLLGAGAVLIMPVVAGLLCSAGAALLFTLLSLVQSTQAAGAQHSAQFSQAHSCQAVAGPELFYATSPYGLSIYYWPDIVAVQMHRSDVYVLTKSDKALFIPRSAFADRAAAEAFMQSLRAFWQQGKNAPSVQAPAPAA